MDDEQRMLIAWQSRLTELDRAEPSARWKEGYRRGCVAAEERAAKAERARKLESDTGTVLAKQLAAARERERRLEAALIETKRWFEEDTYHDLDELSDDAKHVLSVVSSALALTLTLTPSPPAPSERERRLEAALRDIDRYRPNQRCAIDDWEQARSFIRYIVSSALAATDEATTKHETEPCCECGEDYPRADLIERGHVYCPKCRATNAKKGEG